MIFLGYITFSHSFINVSFSFRLIYHSPSLSLSPPHSFLPFPSFSLSFHYYNTSDDIWSNMMNEPLHPVSQMTPYTTLPNDPIPHNIIPYFWNPFAFSQHQNKRWGNKTWLLENYIQKVFLNTSFLNINLLFLSNSFLLSLFLYSFIILSPSLFLPLSLSLSLSSSFCFHLSRSLYFNFPYLSLSFSPSSWNLPLFPFSLKTRIIIIIWSLLSCPISRGGRGTTRLGFWE